MSRAQCRVRRRDCGTASNGGNFSRTIEEGVMRIGARALHPRTTEERMKRFAVGALAAFMMPGAAHVLAQNYPTKPVRLVVPSSPGGGTDITARILAPKLSELLGQQVVVENRPGAGTTIGNEHVARATPDGYTLLMGISTLAINAAVYKKLGYDALRDFAPISQAVSVPNVLVVHPSLPTKTVREFIAFAKARPGKLPAGSAGVGTNPHLSLELFNTMAGIDLLHVPYKGSGQGLVGLLGGEVAVMFPSLPTVISQVRAGRLRALGVTTERRSQVLPEVPSIAEAGLPGYEATQWFGVLAPAGTPHPIIARLHEDVVAALRSPQVTKTLLNEGAEVVASSPEEFARYLKSETEKWAKVVKAAGVPQQ
jgi:tripartite-type tricarboxylate transporter receptor subunit TctC